MKKTISLLLMSLMGMVGTYAFAARPAKTRSNACSRRLMFYIPIMATPDKGFRKKCWPTPSAWWWCPT